MVGVNEFIQIVSFFEQSPFKLRCAAIFTICAILMHLSSASPREGGPLADVGEYGDFMGTCGGGNVGT